MVIFQKSGLNRGFPYNVLSPESATPLGLFSATPLGLFSNRIPGLSRKTQALQLPFETILGLMPFCTLFHLIC
jgi:hypothetical protein